MQDPAAAAAFQMMKPQFPEQEQLKCPRCDSSNTKFCYYNNYNLSQPRHFCKNCKRYWTKGGSLRNIPVGGGSRKNTKRSSSSSSSSTKRSSISSSSTSSATNSSSSTVTGITATATVTAATAAKVEVQQPKMDQENRMMDVTGISFSSMLTANDQFGSIMEGLNNSNGSGLKLMHMGGFEENVVDSSGHGLSSDPGLDVQSNGGDPESYWNGSNVVWPDLAIYTPGSTFQ